MSTVSLGPKGSVAVRRSNDTYSVRADVRITNERLAFAAAHRIAAAVFAAPGSHTAYVADQRGVVQVVVELSKATEAEYVAAEKALRAAVEASS